MDSKSFSSPGCCRLAKNPQGSEAALSLPFFKITFALPHLIGDVRKTNDLVKAEPVNY
jgi:hypothetical protein